MHREVRKEGKEGGSLLKLLPRWPVLFVTSFCSSTATLKKSLDRIERRLNTIISFRLFNRKSDAPVHTVRLKLLCFGPELF